MNTLIVIQKYAHHTCFCALLAFTGVTVANNATVTTSVSRDSLTVGDRIEYIVTLTVPKDIAVVPPEPEQDFGNLTIKDYRKDKTDLGGRDSLDFRYVLTTYKVEPCSIPALPYILVKDSVPDTLMTGPVPLRVISVVTTDTADIKGLKPQQAAGKPPLVWLWIALIVYILTGFIMGVRFHWRKTRWVPPPPPPKPPYEEAIIALNKFDTKQYLNQGQIKPFAFALSEILKRYISRRYGVLASEYTTEEMLEWLTHAPLDPEPKAEAEWFFTTSDPVKFAQYVPDLDILHRLEQEARSFVEKTRPVKHATGEQPPGGGNAAMTAGNADTSSRNKDE
ncbi:MAG: hypothetical protein GF350_17270 [Chitinivibrionales bacterium]|nr:hypothetical protein [Chitinivibrionales bacterium]